MLAIIYLIVMFLAGDLICRRFYRFDSLLQRLSSSFLVGLLLSTWATYLFALAFASTQKPLLGGNVLFFIGSGLLIFLLCRRDAVKFSDVRQSFDSTDKWEWIFAAIYFAFAYALTFGSFGMSDGKLKTDQIVWNDFGPNLSLVQSFAVGHNFPTEYPHFIGEPIRYHFLYWFQAGNLTFLGLDIDWSLNVLSALSWTAMLILIGVFGRVAFDSKAVGRIAAILFFFFGTLSYIPFLYSFGSIFAAFHAVADMNDWLKSIYTFPGEQWGVWSLGTFMAQRHLPTTIGIFLIVFIFLIEQIKGKLGLNQNPALDSSPEVGRLPNSDDEAETTGNLSPGNFNSGVLPLKETNRKYFDRSFRTYIFSGVLLGLLPLWNSAIYLSAAAVIAGLFLVFPNRLRTLYLLIASAIVAVPQILFLRASESKKLAELFQFGYVVEPATIANVLKYFAFTFGLKTVFAVFALAILKNFHRRLFLALLVLPILAFSTKLSTDMMNNHKFLHVWMIFINLFFACAVWRLWKSSIAGKIAAALLVAAVAFGGMIEFVRIYNDNVVEIPFSGGPLYEWLYANTQPEDVFLSPKFVHHPILLSGRRIFYGSSYFGWSMGYPTGKRDALYKRMFEEQNPTELLRLLRENNIKYVAYDNDIRGGDYKYTSNEAVCEANFEKVFVDAENKYNSLVIYKVPPE